MNRKNLNTFVKGFILLLLCNLSVMNANARGNSSGKTPDFAFPKTVADSAMTNLKSALAAGKADSEEVLRSLIDYSTAEISITRDNINLALDAANLAEAQTSSVQQRALIAMLKAILYNRYYNSDRWNFDRRELPAEPYPADIARWSGLQFRNRVCDLIESALSSPEDLKKSRLSDWTGVISASPLTLVYYPTLYDFIGSRAISMLGEYPSSYSRVEKLKKDIFSGLIAFHAADKAPFINYSLMSGAYDSFGSRMGFYRDNSSSEYSGQILDMPRYLVDDNSRHAWADALRDNISRFPNFWNINELRNNLNYILKESVRASVNTAAVAPGTPFEIGMRIANAKVAFVDFYKVPASSFGSVEFRKVKASRPALSLRIATDSVAPFTSDTTVTATLNEAGKYLMVVRGENEPVASDRHFPVMEVSSLYGAIFQMDNAPEAYLLAVNPTTGEPEKSVSATFTPNSGRNKKTTPRHLGVTDNDGFVTIPSGTEDYSYGAISLKKGTASFSFYSAMPFMQKLSASTSYSYSGYTSRAIYRPGDELDFAFVISGRKGKETFLVKDMPATVTLYNANNQPCDTLELTTDSYGRIAGKMVLPSSGLTGQFRLSAKIKDSSDRNYGGAFFTVSDYKLPTFEVKFTSVKKDFPSKGDVTVCGVVADYTGFPLAGASLAVSLNKARRLPWWWGAPEEKVCSSDTVADASGKFELTFPADKLAGNSTFCVSVDATSPTGETQSGKEYFTTGRPMLIVPEIATNINADEAVNLAVKVLDDSYSPVSDIALVYTLKNDKGEAVATGRFTPAKSEADFSKVPQGSYTLTVSSADSSLAEPTETSVVIYRPSEKSSAVKMPLWVPVTSCEFTKGKASVLYAVDEGTSHIFAFISGSDGSSDIKTLKSGAGYHRLEVKNFSDNTETVWVKMVCMKNGRLHTYDITISNPAASDDIRVEIESFRDRMVPGQNEKWIFRVKDAQGRPVKSALLLDVYNAALDKLASNQFNAPYFNIYRRGGIFSMNSAMIYCSANWDSSVNYLKETVLAQPEFDDYGLGLGFSAFGVALTGSAVADFASDGVVNTMARSYNAPAMMQMKMAKAEMTEEAAEEAETDIEGGAAESEPDKNFDYRPSETPLMMFRPMLTTDSEGVETVEFTVPNANALWNLVLAGYTEGLRKTVLRKSFVTSKPVMVNPNPPRFLRQGDSAQLLANVMNNTDSAMVAEVTVEIFNPVDGSVYATRSQTFELAAMSSDVMTTTVDAAPDMTSVGYRIKAVSGLYTDGEQVVIPVLPSSEPVFESQPFYIAPEEKDFSIQLPTVPADASVVLEYCDNPRWLVASALPGLRKNPGNDANSAAASIFSAAVARGILRDNPAVALAIEEWSKNPSDSMLISMLEKNQDLKLTLLNATPWVETAASDTERMARLSLLFDKKEIDNTFTTAVEALSKLKGDNGGWKWYAGADEASEWTTLNVLGMLGNLEKLGYLPDSKELSAQIKKSLEWIDGRMYASYLKSKTPGSFMDYAFIRSQFSSSAPSTDAARLIAEVRQYIIGNWKKMQLSEKPAAAMILKAGGYDRVAGMIMESMTQYGKSSPEKGMWFPAFQDFKSWWPMTTNIGTALALMAYEDVNPGCKEASMLAQWLVLQKEAQNWGTSVATTQVISALLNVGNLRLAPAGSSEFTLGETVLTPSHIERLTGSFRMPLTGYSPSGKTLSLSHTGDTPAYGSVMIRFEASPDSIKAKGCDDLSVEKSLSVRRSAPEGFIWENITELNVGDRVKVTLVITASRDLQYVTVVDNRAAAFEPVDQLPGYEFSDGTAFYRENRDSSTNLFIEWLPKGTYMLSYELNVNNAGVYTSGLATAQSQYSPAISAHSSGTVYEIK